MIQLENKYNQGDFLDFIENSFLIDFNKDIRKVNISNLKLLKNVFSLGSSKSLDLQVFEFQYSGSSNKRISITKEAFQIMKQHSIFNALAVFYSKDNDDWRFSFMTMNPVRNEKGIISNQYSNPKRLSFFLGPNAKVNTPNKFLVQKGLVLDLNDLKSRFSLEVVNKEFYKEISLLFVQLVGGIIYIGKKKEVFTPLLKLPNIENENIVGSEFGVRLIGRIIFCWFLREKNSDKGISLMPNALLSSDAVKNNSDYYHLILEPIFFEVLNKPIKSRVNNYSDKQFSLIPYLNGGLFSPHDDDYYKKMNSEVQSQFQDTLIIPNEWLIKFFKVLETYNFTIDENSSFDEELSIDPEMLGRIFENLLAEINPETGESARKSTGSYYTPRAIVDYMVDESLFLYLKGKLNLDEKKLRSVINYNLNDDENILEEDEKQDITDALEKVKILDPACGSGAFPIGALQKIVYILQQVDPGGQTWFEKQIKNTPPE
ncbi:MAG: hypothetical protein ACYDBX_04455, partial [Patescibacteria group bacterium]